MTYTLKSKFLRLLGFYFNILTKIPGKGSLRSLGQVGEKRVVSAVFCGLGKVLRKCLRGSDRLHNVRDRWFSGVFRSFRAFGRLFQFLRGEELNVQDRSFSGVLRSFVAFFSISEVLTDFFCFCEGSDRPCRVLWFW